MKLQESKNTFVKVRCQNCKNEQIIFTRAASSVTCTVCGTVLAESNGGKAKILAQVLEEMK